MQIHRKTMVIKMYRHVLVQNPHLEVDLEELVDEKEHAPLLRVIDASAAREQDRSIGVLEGKNKPISAAESETCMPVCAHVLTLECVYIHILWLLTSAIDDVFLLH